MCANSEPFAVYGQKGSTSNLNQRKITMKTKEVQKTKGKSFPNGGSKSCNKEIKSDAIKTTSQEDKQVLFIEPSSVLASCRAIK